VKQTLKQKNEAIIQAERNQKIQPQQQKPPCNHYNVFIVQQLSRPNSLSAHSDIFWISAYFGLLSGELSQSDEGFEEKRAHKKSKSFKSPLVTARDSSSETLSVYCFSLPFS